MTEPCRNLVFVDDESEEDFMAGIKASQEKAIQEAIVKFKAINEALHVEVFMDMYANSYMDIITPVFLDVYGIVIDEDRITKEQVLEKVKNHPMCYPRLPGKYRRDKDVILLVTASKREHICCLDTSIKFDLDDEFRKDVELIKAIVSYDKCNIKYADSSILSVELVEEFLLGDYTRIIMQSISTNELLAKAFFTRENALRLLAKTSLVYEYLNDELRQDPEIVALAAAFGCYQIAHLIPIKYYEEHPHIIKEMLQRGCCSVILESLLANSDLAKDPEIAILLIEFSRQKIFLVHHQNKEFAARAVEEYGVSLYQHFINFQDEPEVIQALSRFAKKVPPVLQYGCIYGAHNM